MESKVVDLTKVLQAKSDVIYRNNNKLGYLSGDYAYYLRSKEMPVANSHAEAPTSALTFSQAAMHAPGYMYSYRPPTGLEGLSPEQQRQYWQYYRQFAPMDYVVNMEGRSNAVPMFVSACGVKLIALTLDVLLVALCDELFCLQLQNGSEKQDTVNTVQIEQLLQEKGEMASRLDQVRHSV
jgi:hypothetical protein